MLMATGLTRAPGLNATSMALRPGEICGLVGPNGAGKTTLLRALAGLTTGGGTVTLDGRPLARLAPSVRARRIGWLPADRGVAWPLRVRDLVALGLPAANDDAIAAALATVGCTAFIDRRVDTLSTGERARVLLARALVDRPAWLLLDEPIANLDPYHRLTVLTALRTEVARGAGVLVALHDLDLALQRCDRLLLMEAGTIIADGLPHEVLTAQRLAAVFRVRGDPSGWQLA